MGVEKNASDDDLKRAYKKLAIKLHPDKNHAPNASEAFKKVSKAYSVLTKPEDRRYYDQTGEEPGQNMQQRRSRGGGGRSGDIDPEEIFNMFFGGGLFEQPQQRQQRNGQHYQSRSSQPQHNYNSRSQQQRHSDDNPLQALFRQFAPLLFVIFLSMMTGMSSDNSQQYQPRDYKFAFTQSYSFPHKLVTNQLNQIYYVNQYTLSDFQQRIERKYSTDEKVEQTVLRRLEQRCNESKKQRQSYMGQAKRYSNNHDAYEMYLKKAEEVDMEYCETLKRDKRIITGSQRQ